MLTTSVGAPFLTCGVLCTVCCGLSKENSSGGGELAENSMEHPHNMDAAKIMVPKRAHLGLQVMDALIMAISFLLVPEAPVEGLAAGCLDYDRFGCSGVEERLTGR
jgi:hypothetical protein